jgi:hypothetical protein
MTASRLSARMLVVPAPGQRPGRLGRDGTGGGWNWDRTAAPAKTGGAGTDLTGPPPQRHAGPEPEANGATLRKGTRGWNRDLTGPPSAKARGAGTGT